MKLMMISDHASPLSCLGGVDSGGQNVYVDSLSRLLAERDIAVDVYTRRDNTTQPDVVQCTEGVRVFHIAAGPPEFVPKERLLEYMPEFTERCMEHASRERYRLAHANFFMSGLAACEIKRCLGLPFVITFHALGKVRRLHQAAADGFPDERFAIEERIVREADVCIAECPQDKEDLERLYDADPSRIATVPCGVDTSLFFETGQSEARARLALPQNSQILLQLGRIVRRKGIDTVIEALHLLRHSHPNLLLVIVGGESDNPESGQSAEMLRLAALARELGVGTRTIFAGRRQADVLRWYYSAADIFITTPWYEPFGITPLESMACGTPVVGANVGGIKYSVKHAQTGLLVPPKNVRALANAVQFLLCRPHLMRIFGEAGKQRVRQYFTWQQIAARMHAAYMNAIRRQESLHASRVVNLAARRPEAPRAVRTEQGRQRSSR